MSQSNDKNIKMYKKIYSYVKNGDANCHIYTVDGKLFCVFNPMNSRSVPSSFREKLIIFDEDTMRDARRYNIEPTDEFREFTLSFFTKYKIACITTNKLSDQMAEFVPGLKITDFTKREKIIYGSIEKIPIID